MFGFGKKKVVNVQYIEAGKKSAFSQVKVPIDDMPDGYEMDSTIEINGKTWTIVAADPNLKEDFVKSGKVQVFVTKSGAIAPKGPPAPSAGKIGGGAPSSTAPGGTAVSLEAPAEHPYTMATINDEIGVVNAALPNTDAFEIHEDDWRQIEFIAKSQSGKARQEFAKIEAIHKQHKLGDGFKRMHVRTLIPEPLFGTKLSKDAIEQQFRVTDEFRGVTLSSYGGLVELSFALEAAEVGVLWGELDEAGQVASLNLSLPPGQALEISVPDEVTKFCATNGLVLVDWPAMKIYGAGQGR